MSGIISQLIGQFRCALRVPIVSSLRLRPVTTETGEGETIGGDLTVGEQRIIAKLQEAFPDATHIQVADISGGCGAMYQICVESPSFLGLKTVQQHRMVNEVLANEIKSIHGLQLQTKISDNTKKSK
uniref:BolA-like protein 3 n=2 Tax=Arion vulgaris TaxID=1028688 RepID=A0A0B6Y4I8_9EUPU